MEINKSSERLRIFLTFFMVIIALSFMFYFAWRSEPQKISEKENKMVVIWGNNGQALAEDLQGDVKYISLQDDLLKPYCIILVSKISDDQSQGFVLIDHEDYAAHQDFFDSLKAGDVLRFDEDKISLVGAPEDSSESLEEMEKSMEEILEDIKRMDKQLDDLNKKLRESFMERYSVVA